jgi:hypothetical protein
VSTPFEPETGETAGIEPEGVPFATVTVVVVLGADFEKVPVCRETMRFPIL